MLEKQLCQDCIGLQGTQGLTRLPQSFQPFWQCRKAPKVAIVTVSASVTLLPAQITVHFHMTLKDSIHYRTA